MVKRLVVLLFLLLLSWPVYAAVLHVSTTGTKTSGTSIPDDWSDSNCYGNITAAISAMSGGDEVIVNEGTYNNTSACLNVIGRRSNVGAGAVNIPSGTAGAPSKVRARYPLDADHKTILSSAGFASEYYSTLIYVGQPYIEVDGFFLDHTTSYNHWGAIIGGSYITIRRCTMRRAPASLGSGIDSAGYLITGTEGPILLEDCSYVGYTRYGFQISSSGLSPHHIILRRCVARIDYVTATSLRSQPFSAFAVYGDNDSAANGVHHVAFQNCIGIDCPDLSAGYSTWHHYPWYIFKGNNDIMLKGCITLNNDMTTATGKSIYEFIENNYGGANTTIDNCIWWGNTGTAASQPLYFRGSYSNLGVDVINRCTFGNQNQGFGYNRTGPGGANSTLSNSLFVDLTTRSVYLLSSFNTMTYNCFDNESQGIGTPRVAYQNDLEYIVRIENGSNRMDGGLNGSRVGAHIMYQHGVSGTYWDESGWDTETDVPLWPWPYEAGIRDWFSATNNPPSGTTPSTNNTQRGFCAPGMTLTRYIWEAAGNPMPADLYDDVPLEEINVAPTNPTIGVFQEQQFAAIGTYEDSSTRNITNSVTWASSLPSVATITNPGGLATGVSIGQTTISATKDGILGQTTLYVTEAPVYLVSIVVTPTGSSTMLGGTRQFTATGTYSDDSTQDITSTVSWSSSNESVATITSPGGLASAVGVGLTNISASLDGITGDTVFTVIGEIVRGKMMQLSGGIER